MTSIENADEFCNNINIPKQLIKTQHAGEINVESVIVAHSKYVLQQVINFLELNQKKPIKSIINELKGKV